MPWADDECVAGSRSYKFARRRCWFGLTCIETMHMRRPTTDLVRPVRLR